MKKLYSLLILSFLTFLHTSAQCTFVSSSQATGSSTDVTIAKPTGVMNNNVMVAAIHVGWCNSGSSITAPAGWTLIAQTSNTGSGCGPSNPTIQLATFYKVAGMAEPLSYTFSGTTNQFYVGGIVAYSGVNIVVPVNASSNNGAQDACAAIVGSSITTTIPNTKLLGVFFCSVNNSLNNIIPPNSMTERVDVGTTGNHPWGNENLEIADETISAAGATGTRTAGLSGCSSTGWVTGAQLIALTCGPSTGTEETNLSAFHFIAPNPSNGVFEISLGDKTTIPTELVVLDCLGKLILKQAISEKQTTVDLSSSAKGIYFLHLKNTEAVEIRKIVIE